MDLRWLAWQLYEGQTGRHAARLYRWLLQSQDWPLERLLADQQQRLDHMLEYASSHVPYYQKLGLRQSLSAYPVLSRQAIMRHNEDLYVSPRPAGRSYSGSSSGSTGEPVTVHYDTSNVAWRWAVAWRADSWGTELPPTARQVAMWGNPREVKDRASLRARLSEIYHNVYILDCFVLNDDIVRGLHASLTRLRPPIIYGYVSAFTGFVRFARELGLPAPPVQKIMPTAEQTLPEDRKAIEDYFGCPVLERYGSRELGPMAHQCEKGTWHLHTEHFVPEVLQEDGTISRSGKGTLLCTQLNNYLQPVIRYDIADVVDLATVPCDCGRGLPTFRGIEGRVAEHVYCPDGRWVSSIAFTRFLRLTPFPKFRIVQDAADHIKLIVEFAGEVDPAVRSKVIADCNKLLLGQIKVDLEAVEKILPLPNGKSPHVINLLRKSSSST